MKLTAGVFRQLQFGGILVLLAVAVVAGAMYWSSFEQQRQYLTSRDFRLLTGLATQTQNLFDGYARIFQGAVEDVYRAAEPGKVSDKAGRPYTSVQEWLKDASRSVPILRESDFVPLQAPPTPVSGVAWLLRIDVDSRLPLLRLNVVADGKVAEAKVRVLTVSVALATLLEPTFSSKLRQRVFDTLALATPDGRVVFVTGRRQQELQSTPLDALLPATIGHAEVFKQLARTISVQDAIVAGVKYKLFLQPCCAPAVNAGPGDPRAGLLVAGLIEADQLYGEALAISPTLVIAGVVATLLALVSWPFLKVFFIGERQRMTMWDVVQLAACSIVGLALSAIMLITWDVYERLKGDVDEQLEHLA